MKLTTFLATALGTAAIGGMAVAADLRIGLNEDPDSLDPCTVADLRVLAGP